MRRELKGNGPPVVQEEGVAAGSIATPEAPPALASSATPSSLSVRSDRAGRVGPLDEDAKVPFEGPPRWFDAIDAEPLPYPRLPSLTDGPEPLRIPNEAPPRRERSHPLAPSDADAPRDRERPRWRRYVAAPLFVVALVVVAVARSLMLQVLLPLALAAAAVALLLRPRAKRAGRPPDGPRRGLELNVDGLFFHAGLRPRGSGTPQRMLAANEEFGVTLVASRRRDRMIAVLTSKTGTFFVGADFDVTRREASKNFLALATTLPSEDGTLQAMGPDGEPLLVTPKVFAELLDALCRVDPICLARIALTDTRGEAVTVGPYTISSGERTIELESPLEWRCILFQEDFGSSVAFYQGTWIRQGATELVLVSLLPSVWPGMHPEGYVASLDRQAQRDCQLLSGSIEEPPAQEKRVAIERLFMLPVRAMLDHSPRLPTQTAAQA